MRKAPIELELYNQDNEVIKSLSRVIVPWGTLKKAVRLGKTIKKLDDDELDEELMNECAILVVEIFGEEKVTVQELNAYADIGDMISVIQAVGNRGRGIIPNAPPVVG